MSKGRSYRFEGTVGHILDVIQNLPQRGKMLLARGWKEISHPEQAKRGYHTYQEPGSYLRVRFDEPATDKTGFAGVGHYHILNPCAIGTNNMYLDKNGKPVSKNSRASHILPR